MKNSSTTQNTSAPNMAADRDAPARAGRPGARSTRPSTSFMPRVASARSTRPITQPMASSAIAAATAGACSNALSNNPCAARVTAVPISPIARY
jgi:hypothetical protein